MLLKRPKSLQLHKQLQQQQLVENNDRHPKRKRTVKRYIIDDEEDCEQSDDSDFENDHGAKRRLTLGDLSNAPPLKNPLSRIPKDYDPKAILTQKFKVPIANGTSSSSSDFNGGFRRTLGMRRRPANMNRLLYDPNADDVIILWDPKDDETIPLPEKPAAAEPTKQTEKDEEPPKQQKIPGKSLSEILGLKKQESKKAPVMLDPVLTRILRPHQLEGLKFLYRCTTGKVHPEAFGCIMADEMGLGKTLQCISLVWTLLRQSGEMGKPTIEKAIVTCPSSLVRNWANEFVKWLGESRVRPLVIDNAGSKEKITAVKRWSAAQGQIVNPVLIISYETLRSYTKYLKKSPIGLLLCDEGHRLKNGTSLLFQELNSLPVRRRVILSGTPIQNDLSEYYSLFDFANPGLLGTPSEFRRNFETPILRGRDADATEKERQISDDKVAEFWGIVSKFTIRRTNDILTKYLPIKFEHVVFTKLAPLQRSIYDVFLTSPDIKRLLRGQGSQPLKAITMLKKLCNHPGLLNLPDELEGSEDVLPAGYHQSGRHVSVNPEYSGKFMLLQRMLAKIRKETKDKIVIVSNYTQTLDLIQNFCQQKQYGALRLDGTMTIQKRQKLVDQFNDPEGDEFVFLLSSKAGGCGLNLIGANRLILFDPDWNPAADQQALARIWRDGQKKDCFIYRLIASGTIEEKIFQRQSHKQSISNCVVDEATDTERHFSLADMRQLFQLNTESECETHDTFKCKRCIQGKQFRQADAMQYGDASTWDHYDKDMLKLPDPMLREEAGKGVVSYVFEFISHMK
ncbi:dna repair and recombination protein rad54 [Lichtheimia corymbifera JMRC:FSU:9682]|uniref:Dna repair and recombination protein rad54 n=1 Tax=Lichtheimia corymbifera JMRC:FSU:9682 TaxID=1263082 RepID=A0A068RF60_9FUNG|nr:dna repair and recombination protein rad54 [Lichtheimia corymbifera JMRC:FSU:9682]